MKIRREAKLALTALAAVFILIWGINFLKGSSLFESKSTFYGVYDSVEGLKVSSGVIYRGYQVGQVISIQFTGERFDRVLVKFSVDKGLELPSNTLAMIQSADLMGSKVVALVPGRFPRVCGKWGYLAVPGGAWAYGTGEPANVAIETESRAFAGIIGFRDVNSSRVV